LTAWKPIAREGEPQVRGIDPDAPGLLLVDIRLSEYPTPQWVQLFMNQAWNVSMHGPEIRGNLVRITPSDNELKKYVDDVNSRIAAANAEYEERVLPDLQRAEDAAKRKAVEERQRLERARGELKDL
jgi:hypothetical protein